MITFKSQNDIAFLVVKKSILLRLDEEQYDSIHKLMGHKLISEDGVELERMHIGNNQDFYRRLLSIGVGVLKKEWDEKVKKYESQDSH